MWWAGAKVCDVYFGTRALVVSGGGAAIAVTKVDGFDAALAAFAGWSGGATNRQRIRLWLSGGLCRPFMVPVVPGMTNEAEIAIAAATLAPSHTGLQSPCTVFLERAVAGAPTMATAVAQNQLAGIHAVAHQNALQHRLISIRPWWAEVLRHGLVLEPRLAAMGVQDCDSMTVLTGRPPGTFDSVATYSPVLDLETSRSVMSRAMSATDAAVDAELVGRLTLNDVQVDAGVQTFALAALTVFSR